jgi:integrase
MNDKQDDGAIQNGNQVASPAKRRESYQQGTVVRVRRAKGPDVWVIRYYRYDLHGNSERVSEIFSDVEECPTKAAAEKKAAEIRDRINNERICVFFSDLEKKFVKESLPQVRPHTRKSYESNLKHLRGMWEKTRIEEMCKDSMSIQLWVNGLCKPSGEPYSLQTRKHVRNLLHHMFEDAMRWGYLSVQRNPISLVIVNKGKRPKERETALTPKQISHLLNDPETPEHLRMIICIAVCTGMRISEILGLKWGDIDFKGKSLKIIRTMDGKHEGDPKTEESKVEEYPLHDLLLSRLDKWKKANEEFGEWVFTSAITGRPFHQSTLCADYLKPALKRAGVKTPPGEAWHIFRHTYRATLDDLDEPLEVQKELMRHSDIAMTLKYGKHARKKKEKLRAANARVVAASGL